MNFGNTHFDRNRANNPSIGPLNIPGQTGTLFRAAPFTLNGSYGLRDMTGGSSNTLLMSEIVIGANSGTSSDHRGDLNNDDNNCSFLNVYTPPNAKIPDDMIGNCLYPNQTTPGIGNPTPSESFDAARSFHSGGVNAVAGRWFGAVLQEYHRDPDLESTRDQGRQRGDLRRLALRPGICCLRQHSRRGIGTVKSG